MAAEVKFGYQCPLYPWDLLCRLVRHAEKAGMDSVTMPDHVMSSGIRRIDALEAWTVLAAFATKTRRVKLGTCVSDIHRRHPAVLAQTVATVDVISNGRTILGIGAGEAMNLNPYGIQWDKPVSRTREALFLIKKLWTEDRVDYEGAFYKMHKASVSKPTQKPHPPIWVAGNSEKTMRIASELADGWVPFFVTPEIYKEMLADVKNFARKSGRDPSKIEPALFVCAVVAEDREAATELISLPAKMWALLLSEHLKKRGCNITDEYSINKFSFSDSEHLKAMVNEAKELPSEIVDRLGVVYGSPDDCIQKIEEYIKSGVRFFITPMLVPPEIMEQTLKLFTNKVLSYFKAVK